MNNSAAPVLSATGIKRHYRSAEEKRRIVEETLLPGVSVAVVARAHSVNANLVFHWRKLYQAGLLADRGATSLGKAGTSGVRLLPVRVAEDAQNQRLAEVRRQRMQNHFFVLGFHWISCFRFSVTAATFYCILHTVLANGNKISSKS